jgi:hypothetical protein
MTTLSHGKVSLFSTYKKISLIRLCKDLGIPNPSLLTKDRIIEILESAESDFPLASPADLLTAFKPYAALIAESQRIQKDISSYTNRLRESIYSLLGHPISRLPFLVAKDEIPPKEMLAIRANISSLEELHEFFKTKAICKPGQDTSYDPVLHDGPESMKEGEKCTPASTGIITHDGIVLIKAAVGKVIP